MSYEIEYARLCIKSNSGYSPLWLSGSSNCTETTYGTNGRRYERLERGWSFWCNMIGASRSELTQFAESLASKDHELWKRGSKWIVGKDVLNWVDSAICSAVPIESVLRANQKQSVCCFLNVYEKGSFDHHKELQEDISTTEQFDDWLSRAKFCLCSAKAAGKSAYPIICFYEQERLICPQNIEGMKDVIIAIKSNRGYVEDVTENRAAFTYDINKAKVFSAKEAQEIIFSSPFSEIRHAKIIKANKRTPKAVVVTSSGTYVQFVSRSRIHLTKNIKYAKSFYTLAQAEKFCDKYNAHIGVGNKLSAKPI